MQDLRISVIQTALHWESVDANLAMLEEKIWKIQKETDLIVLPEMFNAGFSMNTALAEPMNSKTCRWMKQQAAQTQAAIVGSFMVNEGGKFYNRLVFMKPDGTSEHYDKRHLFRMSDEGSKLQAGTKKVIINYKGWNILPLVCYDLRFPVWSRNRFDKEGKAEYDLMICVANWPTPRFRAWDTLLQARAIENLCYVAGVNRVGKDGNGLEYSGNSAVIEPKGDYLFFRQDWEKIGTTTLSAKNLLDYREKFPAGLDADDFEIQL